MAMARSLHSSLAAMIREAHAASTESAATGIPIDEVTQLRAERAREASDAADRRLSRRSVLKAGAAIGVLAATGSLALPRSARAATQPRIAIVGGGVAGLRCAHRLWTKWKRPSTVYEWDDRVGGRLETLRGYFANGQIVEQHGEFVSSEHAATLNLAAGLGLTLDTASTPASYPTGTEDTYWLNGSRYSQAMLNADWQRFAWATFNNAIQQAPWPTRYTSYTQAGYDFDHMSVVDWINGNIPGGLSSQFGRLCYYVVISEYGGPPEQQSALNLVYILGYNDSSNGRQYQSKTTPSLYGTDEKWHIHGGNDQLITGMVGQLPSGSVKTGYQLVALKDNGNLTYTLTFQVGTSATQITADHVVLALPFSTLRNVDLSKTNLSPLKRTAISNLQLGHNAKIQIQVAGRPWNSDGYTGNMLTDLNLTAPGTPSGPAIGVDGGWDATSYQPGSTGIFLDFPGGADGAALAAKYGLAVDEGPAPVKMVNDVLVNLEKVFPGITTAWNAGPKLAYYNDGNIDPHLYGAWSQYGIGQYTGFSGIEPVREGNIHFAGEHTSMDFQGFIEGGVTSGERVAGEI
jgi:monoamine oxidase